MKKLTISLLSILSIFTAYSQPKLPGQCEVWLPKAIDKEVISNIDAYKVATKPYGQTPAPSQKNFWVVYSDRENNPTFSEPKKGASRCGSLSFNERLIIASIKNDFALVYSEPKSERYPYISSAAISKGWVPLSSLLLWSKGLANSADISYKAVICANLDVNGSDSEGRLYKHPNGAPCGNLKTNMYFYFIMKEEGNKVLLAHYADISHSLSGLYGWIDKNSYVPWNQRTCLEPTWDRSNVEWFTANGKKWQVFARKDKMTGQAPAEDKFTTKLRVRHDKEGNIINDSYTSEYKYRTMPVNSLRYPILDDCSKDLYNCSSFGTLGKKAEVMNIDDDIRIAIENLKNTEVINIGIVIDGTSSMKPYFTSVKDAIVEGCKYFGDSKVNVAVAIYRDKEDGEAVFESFPSAGGFTDNPINTNLKKFLDSGGKYGVRSVATGETESVYYGIKSAIQRFNFNPKQSNLLLVVGDCGDNGKFGVKREEIIKLLAEKRISMMGFQVRNKNNEAYQSFNTQLTFIMKEGMQQRYTLQAIQNNKQQTNAKVEAKPYSDGTGWTIYNTNTGKDKMNLYKYIHRRNKSIGTEMDATELTSLMESTIGEWKASIDYIRSIAGTRIDGFEVNEDGDGTLTDALVDLFGGDRARYERIKKGNTLTSFRGYTLKKDPTSGREYFKVVVFLPAPELKTLVEKLEPVNRIAQYNRLSNDRQPYYEAMITLASTLIAQDKIKDVKYKEIIARIFGLDNASTNFGGPSLADIVDPNVVSQREYIKILDKMTSSYQKLQHVLGEDYPFIRETAGSDDKYYWLPAEYLPL